MSTFQVGDRVQLLIRSWGHPKDSIGKIIFIHNEYWVGIAWDNCTCSKPADDNGLLLYCDFYRTDGSNRIFKPLIEKSLISTENRWKRICLGSE